MTVARDDGFYWVLEPDDEGVPSIAEWVNGFWWFPGDTRERRDRDVTVVSGPLTPPASD